MRTKQFGLIGACVLLAVAALPARAEVGPENMGITNLLAVTAASTAGGAIGRAITVDNQEHVGLQLNFTGSGAGTANAVIALQRTADGTNYETAPLLIITVAATGNTPVAYYTNLNRDWIGGAYKFRTLYVSNANAVTLTNVSAWVVKKKIRP
jgi:hypothetical protein